MAKGHRKGGQPTKLTPTIRREMAKGIEAGNYPSVVARSLGITDHLHRKWMYKGEDGELDSQGRDNYIQYYHAILEAEANAEKKLAQLWVDKMPEDWRATQTFMERRWGERWGKNDKIRQEVSGPNGESIQHTVDLSRLSDKELDVLNEIVGKATDAGTDSSREG